MPAHQSQHVASLFRSFIEFFFHIKYGIDHNDETILFPQCKFLNPHVLKKKKKIKGEYFSVGGVKKSKDVMT